MTTSTSQRMRCSSGRGDVFQVSLATVYNTLNELVSMGEVQQVEAGVGPTRYDPNTKDGHHYLVCLKCGDLRRLRIRK